MGVFLNLCAPTPQQHPHLRQHPYTCPAPRSTIQLSDALTQPLGCLQTKVNVPSRSMTWGPREARQFRGYIGCFFVPVHGWMLVLLCALLCRVRGMLRAKPRRNCGLSCLQHSGAECIEEGKSRGSQAFSDLSLVTSSGLWWLGCDFDIYFWKLL